MRNIKLDVNHACQTDSSLRYSSSDLIKLCETNCNEHSDRSAKGPKFTRNLVATLFGKIFWVNQTLNQYKATSNSVASLA